MLTIATDEHIFTILHRLDIEIEFTGPDLEYRILQARLNGAPITLKTLSDDEMNRLEKIVDGDLKWRKKTCDWGEHG